MFQSTKMGEHDENEDYQIVLSVHGTYRKSIVLSNLHTENGMVLGWQGNSTVDKIVGVFISLPVKKLTIKPHL